MMKQTKNALARIRQLFPHGSATSLRHFFRMRNRLLATALLISFCCLLAADIAVAADTGRRCCAYVMYTPEEGENLIRSTGLTYLKSSNQIIVVGVNGYVGFIDNPTDTFCAEYSKVVKGLHTIAPSPWGERDFQGVTTLGSSEDSVLILEIPTMYYCGKEPTVGATGTPILHKLDLLSGQITWSKGVTVGPSNDFGGGIAWIPDGSEEGIFFISLKSERQIARYRVTDDGTINYLDTITLPISSLNKYPAYNMNALEYNVRRDGVRELWAHYASNLQPTAALENPMSDDRLYAYELGSDGAIKGTEPLGESTSMADRGRPECPNGLAVLNHPNPDSTKALVYYASGNRPVYELWYKRYSSRFARCPWYYNILIACRLPAPQNCCVELPKDACTDAGGTHDYAPYKRYGDPTPLCTENPCSPDILHRCELGLCCVEKTKEACMDDGGRYYMDDWKLWDDPKTLCTENICGFTRSWFMLLLDSSE